MQNKTPENKSIKNRHALALNNKPGTVQNTSYAFNTQAGKLVLLSLLTT